MSKIAATTGATSHTATESRSFPIQQYADVRHALLFRNGETSPSGPEMPIPGKTWQVGKLWLKSLLQELLAPPSPALRLSGKKLNARVAKTPDYSHAAIYSTSTESETFSKHT